MASLPSEFSRHYFTILLGGCVTRTVASLHLQSSVFYPRYTLYLGRAQYILAVRFHRIPSKNNIVAEKRCCGDPKGYVPLVAGRFLASEKGRQRVVIKQASVGRGKAERFPLQGGSVRLNPQGRFLRSRVFHSSNLEESQQHKLIRRVG